MIFHKIAKCYDILWLSLKLFLFHENIYSTHIVPENQENLILSYFCQGCIYHLWYNKTVFVLVEEYKNDANKGKPTIKILL